MSTPDNHSGDDIGLEARADDPIVAAIRGTPMPMVITDCSAPEVPIVFANDAFLRLTGYAREEVIGRNCRFLQGPETDPAVVGAIRAAVKDNRNLAVELLNYRKDGSSFWNALYLSPVRMQDGHVRYFFGTQLDATEKKETELQLRDVTIDLERIVAGRTHDLQQALEQKTVLLHEVDHRVKNNLQLISALMLLQARRAEAPEVRESLTRMLERLNAISTVHRRLFQSEDAAAFDLADFLRDLAADLGGAAGREHITVDLEVEPVAVRADQAAPIALMVNEVVTNALRHAFPDQRRGRLRIALQREEDGYHIVVDDNGVGRDGRAPGFGSTIIDLLGRQLKAKVRYDDAPPGATVHIRLPAAA